MAAGGGVVLVCFWNGSLTYVISAKSNVNRMFVIIDMHHVIKSERLHVLLVEDFQ